MNFSKNVLDCIQTKGFTGNIKQLAEKVSAQLDEPFANVVGAIEELINSGDLCEQEDIYVSSQELGLIKGKLLATTHGYGFVQTGISEDVFVPEKALNGALNNDTVLIKINKSVKEGKHVSEGMILKVIKRGITQIVGTYRQFKNFGYVIPDDTKFNQDIYVPQNAARNAKTGDVVVVDIIMHRKGKNPEGKIAEVLGDRKKKGNDVLALMRQYKIYEEFPHDVLRDTKKIPQTVTEDKKAGRKDFSKITTFTIDGEDAKDFDDAISLEIQPNGNYYLGVHIADVSAYVKFKSPLDAEALKRGTSVYFCDRVVPMLPAELSNGICSLNEGVERLTLSVMMTFDKEGNLLNHEIYESFIKSKYRLTYTKVFAMLQNDSDMCKRYADILDAVKGMHELSEALEKKRQQRGAINFDFAETYLVLDNKGKLVDVRAREQNDAHKLIETFMVVANETIAEHMLKLKVPFVYRVHEEPDTEKMTMFFNFIKLFGINYNTDIEHVTPKDLQQVLDKIEGQQYKQVIEMLMLRSLKKARYLPQCLGHFGLASKYYCHFTSPIRRYPDLTIHRIIKQTLRGKISEFDKAKLESFVEESAQISSEREKLAEEMERAVDDIKKVEFLAGKIGEEYEGIISGIIARGFFVSMDNTCEGFVGFDDMPDDYYNFDDTRMMLIGKQNKFMLGERVKIRVREANLRERRVYFKFVSKVR